MEAQSVSFSDMLLRLILGVQYSHISRHTLKYATCTIQTFEYYIHLQCYPVICMCRCLLIVTHLVMRSILILYTHHYIDRRTALYLKKGSKHHGFAVLPWLCWENSVSFVFVSGYKNPFCVYSYHGSKVESFASHFDALMGMLI